MHSSCCRPIFPLPQTLLIALVWSIMTPSAMRIERATAEAAQQMHGGSGSGGGGGGGAAEVYSIVLDAGSTGSRIHVFKFERRGAGAEAQLSLVSDTFEQLKPGLSSYRDEPEKAAQSLKPLLDIALRAVPQQLQAGTGLSLKATAGLRLLPGSKADDILKVGSIKAGLEAVGAACVRCALARRSRLHACKPAPGGGASGPAAC